ncbi:MAG TPA: hypothetical protein VGG69_11190 [Rhizomicrobium sp.]
MAVIVVLVVAAGLQMAIPSNASLPEDAALAPRRAPEPAQPGAREYPAILMRTVFAPDRAPTILQAQTAGNLSGYEVVGTAIAGHVSTALVRDVTGRVIRIKPDETLQGWRLVSIDRTQLLFDRDGERRTLMVTAAPPRSLPGQPQMAASPRPGSSGSSSDESDADDSSINDNTDNSDSDNNDDN